MSEDLTSRQWRAIASVYSLYVPAPRDAEDANDAEEIAQAALPLLQRAFPPSFLSQLPSGRKRYRKEEAEGEKEEQRQQLWQRHIPAPIDAYLSRLLSADSLEISVGERRLLRLLFRAQRRDDAAAQHDAALRQSIRRAAAKLQQLADRDEAPQKSSGSPKSPQNPKSPKNPKSPQNLKSAQNLKSPKSAPAALPPPVPRAAPNAPTAAAADFSDFSDFACAACGEGGELFRCRHCLRRRHEGCGGPLVESETGLCAACCHDLGLSASASSLRESTSTEERGDEEDCDTSLSGFIVRTDDEDEEEEESEKSEESETSSHVAPKKKWKNKTRRNA